MLQFDCNGSAVAASSHILYIYNRQLTLNLLRGGCSRARRKGESRECGVLPGLELMALLKGSGAF